MPPSCPLKEGGIYPHVVYLYCSMFPKLLFINRRNFCLLGCVGGWKKWLWQTGRAPICLLLMWHTYIIMSSRDCIRVKGEGLDRSYIRHAQLMIHRQIATQNKKIIKKEVCHLYTLTVSYILYGDQDHSSSLSASQASQRLDNHVLHITEHTTCTRPIEGPIQNRSQHNR